MPNLSHLVVIEDILERNHLLQDVISDYVNDEKMLIPPAVLFAISDLDWAMRQLGRYWEIRDKLREEGAIN